MASRYVVLSLLHILLSFNTSPSDVQQFAVWEQDAKDETGFIGYCYLDLFPRRMFPALVLSVPEIPPYLQCP
jgi:hypothetical protein